MKNLIIVFIVFELGYLFRFIADLLPNFFAIETLTIDIKINPFKTIHKAYEYPDFPFYWFAVEDASFMFEGLCYLSLLVSHYKNFNVQKNTNLPPVRTSANDNDRATFGSEQHSENTLFVKLPILDSQTMVSGINEVEEEDSQEEEGQKAL